MTVVTHWNESENGPLGVAAIKQLYQPAERYWISPRRYKPGIKSVGKTPGRRLFVLSGTYQIAGEHWECHLNAGDIADIPSGEFQFQTSDVDETVIVRVYEMPEKYWKGDVIPKSPGP